MKSHKILDNDKTIAHLSIFSDFDARSDDIVECILDQIHEDPDIGFAGFRYKDGLREHLRWEMDEIKDIRTIDENKVKVIIEEAIKKCFAAVSITKSVHIFVFPTFSEFVKEKMNGSTGYSPWKDTILVYINPACISDNAIRSTICHEFAHAVAQNYNELRTILDQLVFDGVAEHFRESVINGDKAPWVKALTEEEAKKIFSEIKDRLESDNNAIRREIFYGAGKYPLWTGYTIGYFIVSSFLKKQKTVSWDDILKMPPKKILSESMFS